MTFKLLLSSLLLLENSRGLHCFGALGVALVISIAQEEQFLTLLMPSILQTWKQPTFGLKVVLVI